jgi:nucleotide-binding universal stress UspA family protein
MAAIDAAQCPTGADRALKKSHRPLGAPVYQHILIATDGSELADNALEHGLSLAKALDARVTVVTATEPWTSVVAGEMVIAFPVDEYDKAQSERAKLVLGLATKAADAKVVTCKTVHAKDQYPADVIVDAAHKSGCDLIVMASHGRRGVSRLLLGSQANIVVTQSTIPVLIVR